LNEKLSQCGFKAHHHHHMYLSQCIKQTITRSQAVASIADRSASQHLWGHMTSSVT